MENALCIEILNLFRMEGAKHASPTRFSPATATNIGIKGRVNSPESPKTPEITEKTENFIKVTKYLTKLKEILINYVWEKSYLKKH